MKIRFFFKRDLKFRQRLKRLHHLNALLFFSLAVTGFVLFSESFRSAYPASRVIVRASHVILGISIVLPYFFYLPKRSRHIESLQHKKPHRQNLYGILTLLALLIVSGFLLLLHRYFPPFISSMALFIHDAATYIGVPYTVYHSITRSRWFKRLVTKKRPENRDNEPRLISDDNPIYRRRTFLKLATGTLIGVVFAPFLLRWLQVVGLGGKSASQLTINEQAFNPLPTPNSQSTPPVGGGKRGQFRYYTVTEMPKLTDQTFSFKIDGLVKEPVTYNWDSFIQLKRVVQVSDFHCVTGWNVNRITWEGIPLTTFLSQAGVKSEATTVKFYSADGVYTDTLTVEEASQKDVMVALLIDGELISRKNGGPVRLIVPRMYGYKSVKWLSRIELIDHEHVGYWEERGYPANAWVNT